jgi:acyl-CoA thioester hydrolase
MNNLIKIQLRYGDLDALGHVNNAVFLTYFELGRVELLKSVQNTFEPTNAGIVIAHAEIDYRKSILFHDDPVLETRVEKIGRKSITFASILRDRNGITCAEGKVVAVYVDQSGTPLAVPDSLRKSLLS